MRVVDVAGALDALGVDYDRRGAELWAPCPLPDHPENEPSFQIRESGEKAGLWRCFGCHEGGGLAGLVQAVKGLDSRRAAWEWLQGHGLVEGRDAALPQIVGVEVAEPQLRDTAPFRLPAEIRFRPLSEWPAPAKRYARSRGLTSRQVERWGIGYAIEGRLRGRLVIVVRDQLGAARRYNARTFIGSRARYMQPDGGFDPFALFGMEHWPARPGASWLVTTEGELNALACERALGVGDYPLAALSGSELLEGQVAALGAFSRICVVSDPDRAGDALWEKVAQTFGRWKELRRVQLVGGDADEQPPDRLRYALTSALA